ncbi:MULTISPECIES: SidA/IucD/PvdA family monooxygenase [unclassified Amycolatopsis]|uniref:lysine N(6)-hydroxylase/L-ornithine N(5)-oxygenase family protein n=1 Tax=unclassified Amycolatopsis TaxID=2618356 RepID=UPI0028748762|nr:MULTISPECIES: SidA/IucD/PvdA family monooxygenase [unclassified Amycolatopsis]MDS0138520.1 SidA/IucD/PvdA family monooxygenase [Amycolatopsis sp. 505]MDS0146203.1 SidA/IucD/PvdA family monooxygenase [Amycolatopsis sp. CM201R]
MRRHHLAGVGIGPFNLSLAALAAGVDGLDAVFFDTRPEFRWHPGLLVEGATLQVPFLADLVTLVDPTNPFSFLNYLRDRGRLLPFYFAERFHMPRVEYDDYGRWAAARLPSCHFGHEVTGIRWAGDAFELTIAGREPVLADNVVLGVGSIPSVPEPLRDLVADPGVLAVHSADYLTHRDELLAAESVTVVGSGQSGAEVVLDLLRGRSTVDGLRWLARTPAFAPMEYSKLGLEQFTPDYTAYFHGLPEAVRDRLLPTQWQLYKGIDTETIGAIHDELYRRSITGPPGAVLTPGVEVVSATTVDGEIALGVWHAHQGRDATLRTAAVVAATGYAEAPTGPLLAGLGDAVRRDRQGRLDVGADYRVALDLPGSLFVQNAERHTHGPGAPDLGLGAWRAAVILNAVCGKTVHELPDRTAFTTFGLEDK